MMLHKVLVGLGSNLDDPCTQVAHAMDLLDTQPNMRVSLRSSLYRSAPVGYLDQPDFINAVVLLETSLSPRAVLDVLLTLESQQGRRRTFLNAPRTLDMDVLMYDDLVHHEHGLTIPHPQMHRRAFVLQPLLEIMPDCVIPSIGRAEQALLQCADQRLERLQSCL